MNSPEKLSVVAIGGGAPHKSSLPHMETAMDMTGVEGKINMLVIPTAKVTKEAHETVATNVTEVFQAKLGHKVTILHAFGGMPERIELEEKIQEADLVYTAGGDTLQMMDIWREHDIDHMLKQRASEGVVLSGVSAGAIAPFTYGHSDSMSYRVPDGEPWEYIPVDALDLVDGAVTPHYDTERQGVPRSQMFHEMLTSEASRRATVRAFGIDNAAALIISAGAISARSTNGHVSTVTFIDPRNPDVTNRMTSSDSIPL